MRTIHEIRDAIQALSPFDRTTLLAWLDASEEAEGIAEPSIAYESQRHMSVEEYLALERRAPVRHEYINGVVYAMSGTSRRHNRIALNLAAALGRRLSGGPCEVFVSDVKVRLDVNREDIFYYPDVMVGCDPEDTAEDYLRHPRLIIEILSPSTASIDRREKLMHYKQIPSLQEYLIVAQAGPEVWVHRRADQWRPQRLLGMEAVAELRSVDLMLPLSHLYQGPPPS